MKEAAKKRKADEKKKEEQKKKHAKQDAEERIKLAEKNKLKAIAEAEDAKKQFIQIVNEEKNPKPKKSAKKMKQREIQDEKKDKEVKEKIATDVQNI